MFAVEDFQPLKLEHKPIFDEHYRKFPPRHSENLFTTLVSWSHFVQPYFLVKDGDLMIMTKPDAQPRFRPPIGERNTDIVRHLTKLSGDSGSEYALVLIDDDTRDWLSGVFPSASFVKHPDYFDYIYRSADLANLEGKNYLKIRNKLSKFRRQQAYEVEPMCQQNIEEIREFLQRWCLWKDCESDPLLDNERLAIMYTVEHCFELDLCGLAIRINGDIEAVTMFESVCQDTAVVHFEKAMPSFEGLYQAINNESAKLLAENHEFINRQSDLGIEGLRTAKQRYHPCQMLEVQHMLLRSGEIKSIGHEHY
ncbi:MAG: phosphatidylglycerol lysyltransferase domain-containing protein [Thermoplasmata archaeon]|nr:phosphatidylglycerol lysyltransferase domain-containing protein [Thermoplasmata archaeon]